MELFFIASPIGLLRILIKDNALYSLERVKKSRLTALFKDKKNSVRYSSSTGKLQQKAKNSNQTNTNDKLKKDLSCFLDKKDFSILDKAIPVLFENADFHKKAEKLKQNQSNLKVSAHTIQLNPKSRISGKRKQRAKQSDKINIKLKEKSGLAKSISRQIELYFAGKLTKFKIPLYKRGADFQKKVWHRLQKIPWGQTKKYSQIARELKKPKAYRAVGNSCGKNPFLIVVPCHRVLSRSGLGGFALGLKTKKYLLNLEQNNF